MANLIYKLDIDSNGRIDKFHNKRGFEIDLKLFAGLSVELSIKKWKKTRTDRQRKFYFGNYVESQIECFMEYWGGHFTKDQVHDWNKSNIFCEEKLIGDEVIKIPRNSSDLSTMEFEASLELGRIWFKQHFNWTLPVPEQQSEMDL